MVNFWAVCGCCTRTDIVREHLEDTLRICDVSANGLYCVSTSIMIYTGHIYSLEPRVPVCDLLICSMLGMLCHIRRSTILNLRASENSSENADRVVGFLLVLKFPH